MKKLSLLILLTMSLGACADKPVTEEIKPVTTNEDTIEDSEVSEKSQEELNSELKELAVVISMGDTLDENIKQGTLVKSTGTISSIDDSGIRGGNFFLNTVEGEHIGLYSIENLNTVEIELNGGQTVTVYGSYQGLDEDGFPTIIGTIIE